ncbi:hypothetical protein J6590_094991 [Homalodisca vitripennis]|nr:hypothetical protein J6590_094991 [Homalodisca vitripennis]
MKLKVLLEPRARRIDLFASRLKGGIPYSTESTTEEVYSATDLVAQSKNSWNGAELEIVVLMVSQFE